MRTAWYVVLVLLTISGLLLLWQFRTAVVIFLLSLALAGAFRPLIERLNQRGVSKGVVLVIVFGFVLFVIAGMILLMGTPLVVDFQNISNDLLRSYEQLKNRWMQGDNVLLSNLVNQLPNSQEIYSSLTEDVSVQDLQTLLGVAQGTFSFVAQLALVLVLSVYWSADQVRFERLWLSLLPVASRARARKIWQAIEVDVGQHIRREATYSLISGLSLWMGYLALGINYPALLAIVGVIARLFPWLGPFLVIFLPLLFGSYYGYWVAFVAVLFTFFILIILEMTIGNRLLPRRRYSSILLVIILFILAESNGLAGIIMATTLTVALQTLLGFLSPPHAVDIVVQKRNSLSAIQSQMKTILEGISELQGNNVSETKNLASRLNNLIFQIPEESKPLQQ